MLSTIRASARHLNRDHWALLVLLGAASFFEGYDFNIVTVALKPLRTTFGTWSFHLSGTTAGSACWATQPATPSPTASSTEPTTWSNGGVAPQSTTRPLSWSTTCTKQTSAPVASVMRAATRWLTHASELECRTTWVVFFLFSAIFVYDSNLGGAADHIAAFLVLPLFLAFARGTERFSPGLCALAGALAGGALVTKYQSAYVTAALGALSLVGIFAGIVLRVRGFLFLGVGFLGLALFTIIWYAAVDLRQTWLWSASGIVAGILILALFALFEKKRQEVLRVVDQFKEWTP